MPTATKAKAIDQAREWYENADGVIFTNYSGLSVEQMQKLRAGLREVGAEIHVVKNTLFRIAIGDDVEKLPGELTSGTTAVTFVKENESQAAKALVDFHESSKKLDIKGAFLYGQVYDADQVEHLSKLPGKEVLLAQLASLVSAPVAKVASTIEAIYAGPLRVIAALAEKVERESGGAPATSEEPEATATEEAATAPETIEAPAAEADAPAEEEGASRPEAQTTEEPAAEADASAQDAPEEPDSPNQEEQEPKE